jgi:hypothetical protein
MDHEQTLHTLLLSYVALILERHGDRPGDNGEFRLWDDLFLPKPTLVSSDEQHELISLIIRTDAWVTFDLDVGRLQLIDIDAWRLVLEHRDH